MNKRFTVGIDDWNGVFLLDEDIQIMYFKFSNIEDAIECEDALKSHCRLMNNLYEENKELKKEIKDLRTFHAEEINKIEVERIL